MGKNKRNALNITREQDFPKWYQEVVSRAELAESSVSRGCMVIRPYGYAIWENIKEVLNKKIKSLGVQNAYFPLIIPLSLLEKEAEHVEGFAKECAVVTHHRLTASKTGEGLEPAGKLEEPYIIRPTSETIIGESFSKWVQSYRDLPLKINQWANVFRWEMRTRLFLRTSEFLWQEGHNVFATAEEAESDSKKMLDMYVDFCRNYLAVECIPGQKTEDEKFPGADATYTFEAMMQDGKALQAGTSHNLGQNFTKSAEIKFSDKDEQEKYAYSTSWGVSTRLVGGLIMSHSDDDGLVLPPKIAPHKAVIIPIIRDESQTAEIMEYCEKIKSSLDETVLIDDSDRKAPNKIWDWVRKGAPIRIEVGAREVAENKIYFAVRDLGKEGKQALPFDEFVAKYEEILAEMQTRLFKETSNRLAENTIEVSTVEELDKVFNDAKKGKLSRSSSSESKHECGCQSGGECSCGDDCQCKKAAEAKANILPKATPFCLIPEALWETPEIQPIMQKHSLSYRCKPFDKKGFIVVGKSY